MTRETLDLVDLKERIALCKDFSGAERAMLLVSVNMIAEYDKVELDMAMSANRGGRIDSMYAYLSVDDGGEGLVASAISAELPMCPLVCYRRETAAKMRPYALLCTQTSGKVIRLARFTKRIDMEIIRP